MQKIENYKTIGSFNETTLKEKSSVFNAQAYPVENEEDALQIVEKTKKKYYDATHHCYAYKLTGNKIKYSDAGEPSGTAVIGALHKMVDGGTIDSSDVVVVPITGHGLKDTNVLNDLAKQAIICPADIKVLEEKLKK